MKNETLLEVVSELVGSTEPYGDSNVDEVRYENQEKIIALVRSGIEDLLNNAEYKKCKEYSVSKIGDRAYYALKEIYLMIKKEIIQENENGCKD